jgi:hypothetical protein
MDTDDYRRRVILVSSIAILVILLSAREAIVLYASRFEKVPQHTSILSGQEWIDELIDGHDGRFYNEFGMRSKLLYERVCPCLLISANAEISR